MMVLAHIFPLLVADMVPETDEHHQSLMLLFRICFMLLAPHFSLDSVAYLSVLIEEKLHIFRKLYPTAKIIPKYHYLVHYPRQILLFGPPIHCWTMRHEAKLLFFKRASRYSNFKNVCFAVSQSHQRWLCYQLQAINYLRPSLETGPIIKSNQIADETDSVLKNQLSSLVNGNLTTVVSHVRWVKVQNMKYQRYVYVLTEWDDVNPHFGLVDDILVLAGDTVVLSVRIYEAMYFDFHCNCFAISHELLHAKIVTQESLFDHRVLYARHSRYSDTLFITPYFL
jgi:hypothetical protein